MEFYDLNNLKRGATGSAVENLYNLFDSTFQYLTNIAIYQYTVPPEYEMRIDLISQFLYNDTQYCDFILDLNTIVNPLNIMNGDNIIYVDSEQISFFRVDESNAKALRNTYLNSSKVSSPDSNRSSYIQNNYALPPTFLEIPTNSVQIISGKIVLGGNA